MSGYDAPIHLSEECINAEENVPKAIIWTSVLGALLGWFAVLVIVYTIANVKAVIGPDVDQPIVSFLLQVLDKDTGLVIFSFIILCCICEGQACMIISSRLVYACSRDGILPGSQYWQRIHHKTPVLAGISELKPLLTIVWINCLIGITLNSLVFGGPVAVGVIFSVGATAQYVAFAIPIALRLIFPNRLRTGRWRLGNYAYVVGIPGILWGILIMSFSAERGSDLTPTLMNWSSLVYGGAMLLAFIWYKVDAEKWYKLPRREKALELESSSSSSS